MSATDILNELKNLPAGEQAAFDRLFRQWQSASTFARPLQKAGMWPDFLTRLRRIYGNKITGDSQSLISELRGDR
jgi:hypothetical protein